MMVETLVDPKIVNSLIFMAFCELFLTNATNVNTKLNCKSSFKVTGLFADKRGHCHMEVSAADNKAAFRPRIETFTGLGRRAARHV